jgi:BlaI family transcriptional regulator, penicillinase repressor
MKDELPPLGDLEHELLTILWTYGEMTAAGVRTRVARKLKDATIRTVLRRLEEKGYVTHSAEAGTFIYRPKESAANGNGTAVAYRGRAVPAHGTWASRLGTLTSVVVQTVGAH